MPLYMDTLGMSDLEVEAALGDFGSVHVVVHCTDCGQDAPGLITPACLLVPADWHSSEETIYCQECSTKHLQMV